MIEAGRDSTILSVASPGKDQLLLQFGVKHWGVWIDCPIRATEHGSSMWHVRLDFDLEYPSMRLLRQEKIIDLFVI